MNGQFGPVCYQVQLKDNKLYLYFRQRQLNYNTPDKVWRDVYAAVDGAIVFLEKHEGELHPPKLIDEAIIFKQDDL